MYCREFRKNLLIRSNENGKSSAKVHVTVTRRGAGAGPTIAHRLVAILADRSMPDCGHKMLQERTMTKYFNLLVLKHVMYEHQNTLSSYVNDAVPHPRCGTLMK